MPQTLGLFLLSGIAFGCPAQAIYKCSSPDGVRYQDSRCAASSKEALVVARDRTVSRKATLRREAPDESRLASTFQVQARDGPLAPGVLDDQVLNMPNWGRPARIIRSKAKRLWREQWVYNDKVSGGERVSLLFENGRLVAQEDGAGADAPAQSLQIRASLQDSP